MGRGAPQPVLYWWGGEKGGGGFEREFRSDLETPILLKNLPISEKVISTLCGELIELFIEDLAEVEIVLRKE